MCVDRCVRVSVCSMMCSLCTFCIIFFNEEEKSFLKKGEAGLLFLMYIHVSGEVHFSFSCLWNVSTRVSKVYNQICFVRCSTHSQTNSFRSEPV